MNRIKIRKIFIILYPFTIFGSNAELRPVIKSTGKKIMHILSAASVNTEREDDSDVTSNAKINVRAVGNAVFNAQEDVVKWSPVVSFIIFLNNNAPM